MTRIITGRLRGRSLSVPAAGTRPTTDRVREAVFNAIVARMDLAGVSVLDLFAGSGALGIEALSRGAGTAWFVESGRQAVSCLTRNTTMVTEALADEAVSVTVRRTPLPAALAGRCPLPGGFDLVLADPPYESAADHDEAVLTALVEGGWLAPDALVVWERARRGPATRWPAGLEIEFERVYGETRVEIGRPVPGGAAGTASDTGADGVVAADSGDDPGDGAAVASSRR